MALVHVLFVYQATKGQAVGQFYSVITVLFVIKTELYTSVFTLGKEKRKKKTPTFGGFICTFSF